MLYRAAMNITGIDQVLRSAVEDGVVPGVVAIALHRDGVIYHGAFGKARAGADTPMGIDSIVRIASMTKAITSVAALQLVERGLLTLDEPASVILPELDELSVLTEGGALRPAQGRVTLRHLLTHTSGFAYPFTSPALSRHLAASGVVGPVVGLETPLLFDPGQRWHYGVSTDWVGRLVEAASGQSLDAYLREHLLGPLGMTDTGFSVGAADGSRLAAIHVREPDGSLTEQPLVVPEPPAVFSGGGGLTSTAKDYARFLRLMLCGGELDGVRLLGDESMNGLLTDQIDGAAGSWESSSPGFSNDVDLTDDGTAGHSLGFLVSRRALPSRRSAGSLSWAGIFNSYYWIDPTRGIAGATFVQVLPFFDPLSVRLFESFERAVYHSVP
jgi:CubicO group peptidase (beta-lactamase class C family)